MSNSFHRSHGGGGPKERLFSTDLIGHSYPFSFILHPLHYLASYRNDHLVPSPQSLWGFFFPASSEVIAEASTRTFPFV